MWQKKAALMFCDIDNGGDQQAVKMFNQSSTVRAVYIDFYQHRLTDSLIKKFTDDSVL